MRTSPGYGTQEVHLGQASSDLVKRLGRPSKRKAVSALREYWIYPELHFEAIVSRRTGNLLSLFFHKGSRLAGDDFFGLSEATLRKGHGDPQKSGGGVRFADGDFLGRWLAYKTGITFFLDEAGKVTTVAISARKRVAPRVSVARHSGSVSAHIAAMRMA